MLEVEEVELRIASEKGVVLWHGKARRGPCRVHEQGAVRGKEDRDVDEHERHG